MWTPKRILLMTLGLVLFLASYLCYTSYLGGVDGLPPLPEGYWPKGDGDPGPAPHERRRAAPLLHLLVVRRQIPSA